MDAPIVKATLQAGALSGLSNILGQLISCWQAGRPYAISPVELTHFVLFSFLACPPNYIWQTWLEGQFPGYGPALSQTEKEKLVDEVVTGDSTSIDEKNTRQGNGNLTDRSTASTREKDKAMTSSSTPTPPVVKQTLNIRNTAIKFALDQTFGAAVNTILFIVGIALLRGQSLESIQHQVTESFWPMIFAGQKLWPLVSVLSFTVVPLEHRTLFGSIVGLFWGIYLSLISGGKK